MRLGGNVVRVDRTAQLVEIAVGGVTGTLMLPLQDVKRPPPPLSQVTIAQSGSGQWYIAETASARELAFHDDFMSTAWVTANDWLYGDTTWWAFDSGSSTGAIGSGDSYTAPHSIGSVEGFADAFDLIAIRKDTSITMTGEKTIWFSGRIGYYPDLAYIAEGSLATGLSEAGDARYVYLDANPFDIALTSVTGYDVTGVTAQTDYPNQMFDFDIVLEGNGNFAAGWINGNGPVWRTSGLPVITDDLYCWWRMDATGAHSLGGVIDYLHLEQFTNVVHPDRLYAGSMAPCPV